MELALLFLPFQARRTLIYISNRFCSTTHNHIVITIVIIIKNQGAIVTAQITMALSTYMGDRLTQFCNVGRKPLFMLGLVTLPIRCALIIWWKDQGDMYLLSTQLLDGVGGGLCGLIHPYLVADLTFGTGRFNVVSTCLVD
jgi:Na+/melibiose symporter-like transporter